MVEIKNENLSKVVVKNSFYVFSSVIISKIGSLIFMIFVARLLLPELFGAYSLVLSIAIIGVTLTTLGLDNSLVFYVSKAIGKKEFSKARASFRYLLKLKGIILVIFILTTLFLSRFFAYTLFEKPLIFVPLLISTLFIATESLRSFFASLFLATKNLRPTPFLELALQTSRIIFSLLVIYFLPNNLKLPGIFLSLALSGVIYLILSLIILIPKEKRIFFGEKIRPERLRILNYLGFTSISTISLLFFGAIDTLMLGRFVDSSHLGYYRVALGLVLTTSAMFSFSGVFLPVFTQINGNRLERGFQKVFRYINLFSIPTFFGAIFLAKYLIPTIFGKEYFLSIFPFYILSALILVTPLFELYSTLFRAKEKAKFLAKFTTFALLLNILLNYILIKIFFETNPKYAIMGVALATVISRLFLLSSLVLEIKSEFKIKIRKSPILNSIMASGVMVVFLILFDYYFQINLFLGMVEILLAAMIYFSILWGIKEIGREDLKLIKIIFNKK